MVLVYLACLYVAGCYLFGVYLLVRVVGRGRLRAVFARVLRPSSAARLSESHHEDHGDPVRSTRRAA